MRDELTLRLTDQLRNRGDAPFVILKDRQLSYASAHKTILSYVAAINQGAPDGPIIGVMASRGAEAYLATLAVTMSGRGWVPLTPSTPVMRLRQMVAQTNMTCILVDAQSLPVFRQVCDGNTNVTGILVGDSSQDDAIEGDLLKPQPASADSVVGRDATSSDLAYILFTSGTTGAPKGVPISRGNAVAYLDAVCGKFGFGPDDRHSQTFELSFDLSVHDLLVPATTGGAIVPFSNADLLASTRKVALSGVTCWFSVPSQLALLARARALKPDVMPDLRLSLFCGEPLPSDLAQAWQRAAPRSILHNLYGPTEATIAITETQIDATTDHRRGIVPLGLPWETGSTCIVDSASDKQVIGEGEGELWLSGAQLTAGYLHLPAMTSSKFTIRDGVRWYRTGDLVERDATGQMHFLSRLDEQIKLRGHRIETLEVEAALRKVTGAQTAVVVPMQRDLNRIEGLTAVVYCDPDDPERVKAAVGDILPGYMVPNEIVFRTGSPPRNASGKVDRKAIKQTLATDRQ